MTRWLQYFIIFLGLVTLGAALMPVHAGGGPAYRTACLSNLKQASLGLIMYQSDFDDRFPLRDHWIDAEYPYTKSWNVFHCSFEKRSAWGYAFNAALSGKRYSPDPKAPLTGMRDEAAKMPLVYDSVNPTKNASDLVTSLPAVPRHKLNNMAYADGHAKALPEPKGP